MPVYRRVPQPIRHIVFYGTLRAGYDAHARLRLRSAFTYVGKCTLGGTLYDLGRYPGFVPGAGVAEGELYRIEKSSLLQKLDEFEGFDTHHPERSPFVRAMIRVKASAVGSAAGRYAWVYVYNGPTAGLPETPGRRWPRERGRRP
jgi:gamma-glutamylcyclotransferase (GGCT)/AIG2-like uncharacterized protein YtfP